MNSSTANLDYVYTRSRLERTSGAHLFCLAFTLVWLLVKHLQVECFVEAATPLFEYCSITRSSNRTPKNISLDVNKVFGSTLGVYTRIRINRYQSAPLLILLDVMASVSTRVR